jgi:hypothetical protein
MDCVLYVFEKHAITVKAPTATVTIQDIILL